MNKAFVFVFADVNPRGGVAIANMVNCEQDVKVKDLEGAQGHYQPLSKALCLSSVNLAHISSDHEQVLEQEFLNDII